MSIVGRRKAAARDEQILYLLRNERAIWNANTLPIGKVLPLRVAPRVVVFDRSAAQTDLVIELTRGQHVFPRQPVFAMNPPGFPNSNLRPESHQFSFSVSGYLALEKPEILQRLAAAFDFSRGQ